MESQNSKLRQFLLGSAAENDVDEIGLRLLTEHGFDEKLSFAEERLIEDFLDNELGAREKELFYQNFLTTPARVELLKETALLRTYARARLAENIETVPEKKNSGNVFDWLIRFFALNLRPIAAVAILLVLAGVGWRFFLSDDLTAIEKEYAVLNARDLASAPETAGFANKSLMPGTFREVAGDAAAAKLNAAGLTENVLFRLALPTGTPPDSTFSLELSKGGQIVFRQTKLRVYQNPNGQELKVVLPKSVLSKGNYQIKLSSGTTYAFAVE